jgi:uncharacterized protein YecE (DUF72 family)
MGEDRGTSERIRIGLAGWSYPDWEGQVYPKPRGFDPLIYLAPYFDIIEINSTFYRILSASMAKQWVQWVTEHPDVRLTATLWQGFTHEGPASAEERGCAHERRLRKGVCPHP